MLLELSIKDFAIIDDLRLAFEPGCNALTGETGAGKSILIDALGAVLGARTSGDMVRTGARGARLEATFDFAILVHRSDFFAALDEAGIEPDDDLLIVSREISSAGRGSARINGRTATVGMLSRIGANLVDIHGQSEHLSLLRPAAHLDVLDRYAGLMPARADVAERVGELRRLRDRIADIEAHARERAQRVDLLRFQVAEIDAAQPRPGEEEELLAERSVLANAERLTRDAAAAYVLLAGGDEAFEGAAAVPVLDALRQASSYLADVAQIDETMTALATRTDELLFLLEDIAAEAREYRDRVEADPARLAAVEDRLDALKQLKRKYGSSIEEVIAYGEEASRELEELTGSATDVRTLKEREAELLTEIGRRAGELSAERQRQGLELAGAVERAIAELHMGRARFAVQLRQAEEERGVPAGGSGERRLAFDVTGVDRVEFLLAPNVGEALKPLAAVASGGEMARLMLALKSILSKADAVPTLVFDEVDVGVGGRSGQVVGEKLWSLAAEHQVLVITHLPQVAAFADAHYRIAKGERDGRIVSLVEPLDDVERIEELAAMLDGLPVTAAARANARALLERVRIWTAAQAGTAQTLALPIG